MADEFVQVVKFKVDDSELVGAIERMRKAFGEGVGGLAKNPAENLEKGIKKAGKEAQKTAKEAENIGKATKKATAETKQLTGAFEKMTGAVKGLVAAYAGFRGISALVGFGKGSIDAFSAQKRAELQLDTVLRNRGMGFASGYIKNAASEIQQRTTIGDESMIAGAAELATYVKDPKQLKRMMALLADYSMGMTGGAELSPEAMTNLATGLGKAFDGTYEAMRKKGFDTSELETISNALKLKEDLEKGNIARDKKTGELKLGNDDKELLKWLRENRGKNIEDLKITALENAMKDWKGLADEFANTDEGKIQQLKNTVGDMREEIGRQLLPVVADLAEHLRENLPTLQSLFEGMKEVILAMMKAVKENFNSLVSFVKGIAWFLTVISSNLPEIVSFVATMKTASAVFPLLAGGMNSLKIAANGLLASNALALVAAGIVALGVTAYQTYKTQMAEFSDNRRQAGDKALKEWQAAEQELANAGGKSEYERRGLYQDAQAKKEAFKDIVRDYAEANGGVAYAEWGKALNESVYMKNSANGGYGGKIRFIRTSPDKKSASDPFSNVNFEAAYAEAMRAVEKSTKGGTTINNIAYTNNIEVNEDELGKRVRENLRTLLTSSLTFEMRSETARAMAL